MQARPVGLIGAGFRFFLLILVSALFSTALYGQSRNLTVAVLVNSQNTSGYNPSSASPGEFQRFVERYLDHLQIPYEIFDVSSAEPPSDLNSRQLVIAGHSGLSLPANWQSAITAAVNAGTGFVNLDSSVGVGSQSHIASIFGASGSTAGTPATQISVPAAVAPGGATPHYITALQRRFDGPNTLTYPFHANDSGVVNSATATILSAAQGTVIARLGNDPLILAKTFGAGRAVHFGTLQYLRADRFGFLMGVDDLFWRSLVWAARKPFVLRGYPRLWAVQMDDTVPGWGIRVRDMYDTTLTGQASGDGKGGPWKVTGFVYTGNLAPASAERTQVISDINAGRLEISPHNFNDVAQGNIYWNSTSGPLTDSQWQANMSALDSWKQGNGGADAIPSLSRSMVPHYWNLSNNTGFDLWNRYGFRYITSIQKPGFAATQNNNGAERLPARPFWKHEMPPKSFEPFSAFTTENYHFFWGDDLTVGSRAGLPPQTFFLFATQYLDFAKYGRVDFAWPGALSSSQTASSSIAQLQQYTWRFWSGLSPVQVFTHDNLSYQNASEADRRTVIAQSSSWLNANGVSHRFMDDMGDYIYARTKSTLSRANYDGAQLTYTFSGQSATADGALISTQLLLFQQGDTEGAWQSVPGFTNGLVVTRGLPPSIQSASPSSGPAGGGTTVVISGAGFTASSSVFFGPASATSTTFISSSTLQAVTPPGVEGPVDIRIVDANGTGVLNGGFTYTPPPRALVAGYSFNEGAGTTTGDLSGNGNTGTINGATWTTVGRFGAALSFNGSSNWVTINDSASLDLTGGMTLEAWVRPSTVSQWRTVILKEQSGGLIYALYANTDTNRPSGHIFTTSEFDTRGTAALPANTWSHLAVTYNGTLLKVFVNGAEVSSRTVGGPIRTSTGVLRIGGNAVWPEYFSGLIDEVRVYNRESTAAEIQADMNTPLGDNTPPSVAITAPANGATVSASVTVTANASDNLAVAGVQFLLDGAPLGAEDTTSPYSVAWNTATVANGSHTLSARARDAVGNTTTSSLVNVTVANVPDTTPPSVSMTAPADGATVSGTVTLSANANDNAGVAGVQFLLDGAVLGSEDTTSPYSISWDSTTATAGPHTLSARARDGAGNITTSAVVNVTNVPPDTTPPVVSMTAPTSGTVLGSVTVSADASDNVGVVGVQFLLDGAPLLTEDTTAPYSISWNSATATNGSHLLSARARDAAGNTITSATVTVTVTGGLNPGLVGAYGFNEGSGTTVTDLSGSGNNGTTTATTWSTTGKFGGALSFNGTSSWVTVPDATSLDLTTSMTLEAWVNLTAGGTAWRTVLLKEQAAGLIYSLYANTDTNRPSGHVFTSSEQDTRGTAALPLNTWTHLAATYDSTTLRLYVNGTQVSSKAIGGDVLVSTGVLRIGGNNIWGEYFSGLIDEVRIYNRVLSASEIQADMNTPVGGTPPPDTTAPSVSITAPANNATVSGTITVTANASDNVGVAGVQFLLDGAALGSEDTTAPYSVSWNTTGTANGAHTLTARARDAATNQATSAAVNVTISNAAPDTSPPSVSLTAPAANATVSGTVALTANASDNVGVVGVQFLVDGTAFGAEDTTAPYSVNWDSSTVANGSHNIAARARDAAGNQTTTANVPVTVSNAPPPPPGLTSVSPNAGTQGQTMSVVLTGTNFRSGATCSLGAGITVTTCAFNSSTQLTASISIASNATTGQRSVTVTNSDLQSATLSNAFTVNVATGPLRLDFAYPNRASFLAAGWSFTATTAAGGARNTEQTGALAVSYDQVAHPGTIRVPLGSGENWQGINNSQNTLFYTPPSDWESFRLRIAAFNPTLNDQQVGLQAYQNDDNYVDVNRGFIGSSRIEMFREVAQATSYMSTSPLTSTGNLILRLDRSGNTYTGFYSTNEGATWVSLGSTTMTLTTPKLAIMIGADAAATIPVVDLDWVEIVTPGPDVTPPTVTLTAPANGATVTGNVTLSATATDNFGVAGVQFLINGIVTGAEDTTAPFSVNWDTTSVSNGPYTITAKARDAAGNETTSAPVSVTVGNGAPPPPDTTPPVVTVTSPLNGATVSGTVTLAANASDNVAVAGVQFYVDGTPVGVEDLTAPYAITWDSTTFPNRVGYGVTARARDAAGNPGTSPAVTITVSNTAPAPSPGLVAAYGFNEGSGTTVADVSGSSNNGTISGAAWSTTGKFGNALSFDGVNDWVTVNDAANLDLTNAMTLEAWVNPSVGNNWRTVLLKEQSGGLIYALYSNTNTNRPSAHIFINSESDTRGPAVIPVNTWTHLATTYDGSTLRLYVNGVQASSLAIAGSMRVSSGVLRLGGNSIWGEFFAGLIDEVRIYNRALTVSEIQSDMNAPVGGAPPPPPVDTVAPTVTVISPATGGTVSGRSVLYAEATDDVGVIGVQFFLDGSPFGSEITTAPFTTTWDTVAASNAAHTFTAVARDASGKQTTSAPVTVTVSNPAGAALVGSWSAPFNWPIVAINLSVTRTGEVLSWDGPPSNGGTSARLWSPSTGVFTAVPNNATNMFCNAAVALPDGRILAIGGHSSFVVGVRNADIFNPITKQWSSVAPMNSQRWYPTATVLPDGRVLAVSGASTCETCIADTPEIYNPTTNSWSELAGARWAVNLYPHMFVLPDGRVLEAGVSRQATETRVLDLTTQTWTTVDANALDGHTAVMYELGKVMKAGSASDVNASTAPAASTTYTLDMTQSSPKWQQVPNMAYPRSFQNLTLLPDGSVLTTGGGSTRDGVDYANAVLAAELWSPQTKTWTTLASQQNGRLYHGSAVLLLDGRVLVAGSGRVGPTPQFNAEIFSPPYLFKGPRPTISSIPNQATYASTFFVGTPDPSAITSVTLLKISSATHGFNMDQRFQRLNFTATAGGVNVQAPANGNLAPPGYYVLFLLNNAGVPSVGGVIQIH